MKEKINVLEPKGGYPPEGAGLRNPVNSVLGRKFHVEYENNAYEKLGIIRKYGEFEDDEGRETPRRYQLIEVDKDAHRAYKQVIVKGTTYQLIPNEYALRVAEDLAKEFGYKEQKVSYTKNGLGVYSEFINKNKTREVKVGDFVATGFQVKNSIDGSIGYGFSGYTLRLMCSNGMTVQEGTEMLKPAKSDIYEALVKDARAIFEPLMLRLEEQIETYKKWTKIQLNMELASLLAANLPTSYLPFVSISKKTHMVKSFQPMTVWEAFNRITDPITHNPLEARHRNWYMTRLNTALNEWETTLIENARAR